MTFKDARSGKVVFVSHCLLNANVKVCGLAAYGGTHSHVVEKLLRSGVGIAQLPCPEFLYMGLGRWWQTRSQYATPGYRRHCAALAQSVADQVVMYRDAGVAVLGILGVEGSPSCGVSRVYEHADWGGQPCAVDCSAAKQAGKGVWTEELEGVFAQRRIVLPQLIGIESERTMAEQGGSVALDVLLCGSDD